MIKPKVDETVPMAAVPAQHAAAVALKKLTAVARLPGRQQPRWILSADTLVEIDNGVLGKPVDREQARDFLTRLAGRIHRVYTALALLPKPAGDAVTRTCRTEVKFREMTADEIDHYLDSGEWTGAAGAYRIQERGGFFVEWIKGSYSNVVGLPLETLYLMLKEQGYFPGL